jgi:putative tryptophan/tyrosine transport system substrate-binding protein
MASHIERRKFLATLGGAVVAWPLVARAQQPAVPVIGFLHIASSDGSADRLRAFCQGLKEAGFAERENVAIEYSWAENQTDRLPELAAELVRRKVAVIATTGGPAVALAAKTATTTIPIVFTTAGDPVAQGLVANLNRPDANVTGVSFLVATLAAKQLGLLHELLPGAARIAVLVDPNNTLLTEAFIPDVRAAASAIRKQIDVLYASTGRDIDTVFESLAQKPVDALLVGPGAFFFNRRVQLVTLATRHAVPTIYGVREFVEAGGLMSYGTSLTDAYRQAGVYTGRILKGEKPADLPVMQSIKFEFVINLNTARAFGLSFPPGLLAIADEVIE